MINRRAVCVENPPEAVVRGLAANEFIESCLAYSARLEKEDLFYYEYLRILVVYINTE